MYVKVKHFIVNFDGCLNHMHNSIYTPLDAPLNRLFVENSSSVS